MNLMIRPSARIGDTLPFGKTNGLRLHQKKGAKESSKLLLQMAISQRIPRED